MNAATENAPQKNHHIARNIFLIVLCMFIIYTSCFTIDETEFGVVTRFGRPLEKVRTPGFNLKLPWPIDKVIRIDRRLLLLDMPEQSLLTYDEKNVLINPFLVWHVTDPILFCATMRDRQSAEIRLTDIANAQLANMVGQLPFNGFINLEASNVEIHKILSSVQGFVDQVASEFGIKINDMAIKTFLVPNQNRISIIARMISERERIAAVYRSMGIEEALTIEAQAASEHERIMGQAHAESTAIRGQGEAEALKILSQAYSKDPQFFRFIRSLESYEAIIGKQSTIFLESNSPLLKFFNGTDAQELQSGTPAKIGP
jgi:membrane protease subunit HflC